MESFKDHRDSILIQQPLPNSDPPPPPQEEEEEEEEAAKWGICMVDYSAQDPLETSLREAEVLKVPLRLSYNL
jgi:hypothetical protein